MGNHENTLIDWLLSNSGRTEIKLQRQTWSDDYLVDLYHINATFRDTQIKSIVGSGKSWREEEALQKALAELIERYVWFNSGDRNTNGFAAHVDKLRATNAAKKELIERDLFLGHWFARRPLFTFNWRALLEPTAVGKKILSALQHPNLEQFEFHCGLTIQCGGYQTVVAAAIHPSLGLHISLALEEDTALAVEKCFLEVIHNCVYKISNPIAPISLEAFMKLKSVSVDGHRRLSMDSKYSRIAFEILFMKADSAETLNDIYLPSIKIEDIVIPYPFQDAPIFICRATCLELQNLFFGSDWTLINMKRLKFFETEKYTVDSSSFLPHPFV